MAALVLCGVAFIASFLAGRRSLVAGLGAVMVVGYLYGILRANVPSAFSHFIFDAAVVALYATQLMKSGSIAERERIQQLRMWVLLLVLWPLMLLVLPLQDPMVQLVGLRAHIFLLPFFLFGARLNREQIYRLALILAGLNLMAFGFALAEFLFGLPHFYPLNDVTELVYRSNDIRASGSLRGAFRIPATFANAGVYGATMALSIPVVLGAWQQKRSRRATLFLAAALGVSVLGVFFSATRTNLLVLGLVLGVSLFSGGMGAVGWAGWVLVLSGVGWAVSSNDRLFLRLLSLSPDAVIERLSWSINRGVFDLVARYPLGNGLGGGGTSMPYFLLHLVRNPLPVENQYATIMLEQGLPGLLLWFAFLIWIFTRRVKSNGGSWNPARSMAKVGCAAFCATGFIGNGLFTAIPFTVLLFIVCGWLSVPEHGVAAPRRAAVEPELQSTDLVEVA